MRYVRASALLAVLGSFIFAAGCSGGSGGATPPVTVPDQSSATLGQPDTTTTDTSGQSAQTATAPVTTDSTVSTAVTSGVPQHILTSTYVYGYAGTPTSVPLSSIKPYLSWAQTSPAYSTLLRSNGIKVDVYTSFWRNHSKDYPLTGYLDLKPGGAHASAEAKTCSGTVIYDPSYSGGYEADARKSSALQHAQVYLSAALAAWRGNYDAIFSDNTDSMGGIPLPCGYSQSTYISATNSVDTNLHIPILFNGFGNVTVPSSQTSLLTPSNVLGGMCEICLSGHNNRTNTDYVVTDSKWQGEEQAEIATVAKHKLYWVYARATGSAASSIKSRMYVIASFLMTYDPKYAMLQEAYSTANGFKVEPETGLVPMSPLTTSSTIGGYLRSGGAYMREFGACYYRGVNKGRCAVVVNSKGSGSVTVPTTYYHHSMTLSGGGVSSGGTVSFSASRPSSLAAGTGAILFP